MIASLPFLWLTHPVDDVAYFYAQLFDGEVLAEHYTDTMQSASIRVAGHVLHLFKGRTPWRCPHQASLMVGCSTQAELDRIWAGLERDGDPQGGGWITDKFGVTWQVVPATLREWLGDPQHGPRVAELMSQLTKLDFAPLEAALRED